jgi:hypothetical protein
MIRPRVVFEEAFGVLGFSLSLMHLKISSGTRILPGFLVN